MLDTEHTYKYFPFSIQIRRNVWRDFEKEELTIATGEPGETFVVTARRIAGSLERLSPQSRVTGGEVYLFALLNRVYRHIISAYSNRQNRGALPRGATAAGFPLGSSGFSGILDAFAHIYPSREVPDMGLDAMGRAMPEICLTELIILRLSHDNPALLPFRYLFDDAELAEMVPSRLLEEGLEAYLSDAPPVVPFDLPLPELLRAPIKASPHSLSGQIRFIRQNWQEILPPDLKTELLTGLDVAGEERLHLQGGGGSPQVLEFLRGTRYIGKSGYEYPEFERFSVDAVWMANVVMIAKMTYVWLDQLGRKYGRRIDHLDQIPDEELDRLAGWGFNCLWLIGIWERSAASQKIKHEGGNLEAIASAYSLYDYVIADDLGGGWALQNLKERCAARGIRLASDMVPNHTGIFSRWTLEHPDWFIQLDHPPYPGYSFSGPDLSFSQDVAIQIEDGYWNRSDAAVVFRHYDHRSGRTRYIYHGNDGTSTPWNDTAQLNYLLPEVREAVIQTILHVARQFSVIRFDAAMTLAKKHYQRLWYPQPGHGSGIPSRAEHGMSREEFDHAFPEEFWREVVDRVEAESPGTLLLAEAFWLMEGYFVRTLGMHRVYNSAFMNMLKLEENAKYRQTVKNVLEYDPEILKRFVNFMNNPDERTAVEQFGKEGKYIGAAVLLVTMPGLPMFGHGQIEGFHEKYGMEFRRASWDEPVDQHLVAVHEERIFPLLRRRNVFSSSRDFVFYDFFSGEHVNEDVFAYSNRDGEQRGVVIYHNRFATTSGWIRTSTAIARKHGAEQSLIQTTLGEALSLDSGDGVYYVYRDYGSGFFYVRSGRDIAEKGIFVELHAYHYYAFLDFKEICDDEYGNWGKLCSRLNGRGVASIDDEFKLVRHSGLINRYKLVCTLLCDRQEIFLSPEAGEVPKEETLTFLRDELAAFLMDLRQTGLPLDSDRSSALIVRGLEVLSGVLLLPGGSSEEKVALDGFRELIRSETGTFLLMSSFIAQGVSLIGMLRSSGWFSSFGLDRATAEMYYNLKQEEAAPADPEAMLAFFQALVTTGDLFLPPVAGNEENALFADSAARIFLLVHESDGHDWFNKERFEFFLHWVAAMSVINEAITTGEGRRVLELIIRSSKEVCRIASRADMAGYDLNKLFKVDKISSGEGEC